MEESVQTLNTENAEAKSAPKAPKKEVKASSSASIKKGKKVGGNAKKSVTSGAPVKASENGSGGPLPSGPGTGRRGPTGATGTTLVKIPTPLYQRAKQHIEVLAAEIYRSTGLTAQVRVQTVVEKALMKFLDGKVPSAAK